MHKNGASAHIRLEADRTHRFFIDADGRRLTNSGGFHDALPIDLAVVPTLASLESEETLIRPKTVQRNRSTRLAARYFRNTWYFEEVEQFEIFRCSVERARPGVRLFPPEMVYETPPRVQM